MGLKLHSRKLTSPTVPCVRLGGHKWGEWQVISGIGAGQTLDVSRRCDRCAEEEREVVWKSVAGT